MQRSFKASRLLKLTLATLTIAAAASAMPALAQVDGNVFPPTLAYTPAAGTTINMTGVTTVGSTGTGQVLVTPSGGMGGGTFATNGVSCSFVGNAASAFTVTPQSPSFTPTSPPTTLNLSCTSGVATNVATLSCTEFPGGSPGSTRTWPVICPAGTLPQPPSHSRQRPVQLLASSRSTPSSVVRQQRRSERHRVAAARGQEPRSPPNCITAH